MTGILPVTVQGATYLRTASGDWSTLSEWNDDGVAPPDYAASTVLPGIGDTVILNQDRVIDVTTALGAVGDVIVSNTVDGTFLSTTLNIESGGSLETTGLLTVGAGSDTGTLNVKAGGTLTATGGISVGADPSHSFNVMGGTVTSPTGLSLAGGQFNVSSGTVTLTDPIPGGTTFNVMNPGSTGILNLTGGSFIVDGAIGGIDTIAFRGVINISGGLFSAVGGQTFGNGGLVFNITGDDATINLDNFNIANDGRRVEINYEFDSTGVSPITIGGYMRLNNVTVNVDGSNYEGGPGVINLITSPGANNIAPLAATVTAPFPGLDSEISLEGNNVVVTLTVPGTTWDGSDDLTWTNPDSTSWSGETFTNGDSATFGDTGFGTVTILGAIEPSGVLVNNTLGKDYVFTGDPIGGTFGLTKSGEGSLTLATPNTYTGVTTVSNGTLFVEDAAGLGSTDGQTVVTSTGKLHLMGGIIADDIDVVAKSGSGNINLLAATTTQVTGLLSVDAADLDTRGGGTLQLSGGLEITDVASFNQALIIDTVPINSPDGTLALTSNSGHEINVAGNQLTRLRMAFGSVGLKVGSGIDHAWNSDLVFGAGFTDATNSGFKLDLNGTSQTFGQIVRQSDTATDEALAEVNQEITGGGTLTIGGDLDSLYNGRFTDGATPTNVVKDGAGTLVLNNLNTTYSSTTTGTFEILDGVVESQSGSDFSDFGTVKVSSTNAGSLNLNYVGTDTVFALDLGSGPLPPGEYGAPGSAAPIVGNALISGTGTLTVAAPPGPPLAWDGSSNNDWTNPDSDSWSGETYQDGDGVSFLTANASSVVISGGVAPRSIEVESSADYHFSGDSIGGTTGISKSDTGVLTLASANTYTGVTTVVGGVLKVTHASSLGAITGNTKILNGGALSIEGGITLAEPIAITGSGGGRGSLRSNGENTVTGAITMTSGRIETVDGTGLLVLSGEISGTGSNILVGDIQVDSLIDIGTGSMTFAGSGTNFAGSGFDQGNVISLNASDNYWGATQLYFDASVKLGADDALPHESAVTFGYVDVSNSTAQLDLNGYDQRVASIATHTLGVGGDVNITGGGTLTVYQNIDTEYQGRITDGETPTTLEKDGTGILTLNNLSGTPTSYTGDTYIFAGTLAMNSPDLADESVVEIFSEGKLQLNHGSVDVVSILIMDGEEMPAGTYTQGNSNGFITGSGAIQVGGGSLFDAWLASFPGLSDPDPSLDFDEGGLATGIEYVVGGDPTDGSDDAGMAPIVSSTGAELIFEFRRSDMAHIDPNTSIIVEYGNDLIGWKTAVSGVDGITTTESDDFFGVGIDKVGVSLPVDLAMDGKLFARLNVVVANATQP
ncbi:beta strand repeat-containing protein [Haloferula chungangensis]|uniref:Beta strand repeat-containing protein n=1 Tax=Haloferula chungangensis TaxID=1048331 RepID=A0ABW2LBM3_9BACT